MGSCGRGTAGGVEPHGSQSQGQAGGERATPAAPGWALPAGCFRSSRTWRVPSGPDAVCRDHILVLSSSQVTPPPAPSQLDLPLPTAPCHASIWDPLLPRSPVTCPRVASWNMAGQGDVLSRPSTSGSRPPPTWGARHLLTLCTAFSVTCLTLQPHPTSLFLIPEGSWGDL